MSPTAPPPRSVLIAPSLAAHPTSVPWLELVAVLMGAFISTLNGRLSTFGLADIRGAVGAGFDEGAWITTVQTAAQMLITLPAVWMGATFGPRRVLIGASIAFALISLLTPYSPNLQILLGMQCLSGLASGFFIPLTLSFLLLNMPPRYWTFAIAIYALNLELSTNISASLEGWYVEHLSWRWIFWQNVPLALLMALCLGRGGIVKPITTRPPDDLFALFAGGLGLALIYAALDQGNRLDWFNSGLVCALLSAGVLLLIAILIHSARVPHPLLNLEVIFGAPLPILFVLTAFLRLTITSTAFLIPLYLGSVRGFRALETGDTLIWVALPQLIFCPLAALMLRRSDARLVAAIGFVFISVACLMVAYNLTPLWGSDQFLPSTFLQALGQSFALSGVIFFAVLHLKPEDALTFGVVMQTARLLGGEMGTAFVTTLARVREQVASNLIGQHLQIGDLQVIERVGAYGAATTKIIDPVGAVARGESGLANIVRIAANTQAAIDCFVALGLVTAVALLIVVTRHPAPRSPASPMPLFRQPRANPP